MNEHLHVHSAECKYSCDIHRGERLYSCKVCNRAFSKKRKLTRHQHIHSGECPYVVMCVIRHSVRRAIS
jgi:uncharacterized Zn-finger protein